MTRRAPALSLSLALLVAAAGVLSAAPATARPKRGVTA